MIIGENEYSEIQIVTEDDELIASITDEDIIWKDGYKVVCVPPETFADKAGGRKEAV